MEELQQALMGAITQATSAAEFIKAELPEVVEQLLLWETVNNALWALMGAIMTAFIYPSIKYSIKGWNDDFDKDSDNAVAALSGTLSSILGLIVGIPLLVTDGMDLVQVLIAPKVYLIEYASQLIK